MVRRVSLRAVRASVWAAAISRATSSVSAEAVGLLGAVEATDDTDEAVFEGVVDLAQQALTFLDGGVGAGAFLGDVVQPGVGDREGGVFGEQLQQFGVVGGERAGVIAAEHQQTPMIVARHPAARR